MKTNQKLLTLLVVFAIIFQWILWQNTPFSRGAGIDYLIVYGSSVKNTQLLDDFAAYKESLGYVTSVVSATQAAKESSGSDQAEKLRNYFKKLHTGQGLKFVLLVGDPFVSSQRDRKATGGSVPMRYCYPFPNEHGSSRDVQEDIYRIPTDAYYADLTGDWDSDGDGYFGEFKEDRVNLVPEIYIGRIPFDDAFSIETILAKSVEFELKSKESKQKTLMMATNNSSKVNYSDNATLTELMWNDLFSPKRFTRVTLYEKSGLKRSEYDSNYPLNQVEALKQIKTGNYGLSYIISNGGFMDSLMRLVWTRDKNFNDKPDPEEAEWFPIVTSEDVQKLSVQNGSIYFLSGYMPLAPDWEMDCIGKELLMTQGVAVLGETRLGYFFSNWKSQRDGGLHSTIYYFTQSLLGGKSIGESLYHSFAYSSDTEYYNAYSYGVLYGDPSLSLEQSKKAEDKMPGAPRNLKASLSGNNVTLSWSPATKGTYTIDGYTVFRGTDRNVLSYLTNVNSSALNWEDKSVSPGNTYFYYVKAFDIKKNFSEASNTVSITIKPEDKDTTPPQITIFEPQNNSQSKQAEIKVSGQITDNDSGVSIATINNKRITLDKEGNFSELLSLKEGDNTITVKASDNAGNEAQVRISVNYTKEEIPVDNMPPLIKIFSPKNGDTFSKDTVEINGRIWDEDSGIDRASMNGLNLILSRDGTFSTNAVLQGGTNQLLFEAWDKAGNYASEEFFLVLTQETVIQLTIGKNIAMIDGIPVPLDVPPIILNGRTMVPIRFISEAFGAEVQWDAETRTVRIYFEKTFTRVTLQINNTIARINDKIVTLDAPPTIKNGRTMVPIRFISEAFGATVDWDNATRTVTIKLKS
jgi:hypothetical protein